MQVGPDNLKRSPSNFSHSVILGTFNIQCSSSQVRQLLSPHWVLEFCELQDDLLKHRQALQTTGQDRKAFDQLFTLSSFLLFWVSKQRAKTGRECLSLVGVFFISQNQLRQDLNCSSSHHLATVPSVMWLKSSVIKHCTICSSKDSHKKYTPQFKWCPLCLLLSVLDGNSQAKVRTTVLVSTHLLGTSRGDGECLGHTQVLTAVRNSCHTHSSN